MTAPRIDSHQHFWQYDPIEYDWIDDSMAVLRSDYLPDDLRPLLDAHAIDGSIAVQARQSLAETSFLLELSEQAPWIRGVVGWVDLRADDLDRQLDAVTHPRLVGVRHIAQAEADDFLAGEAFGRGVGQLTSRGLTYDLLVFPRQLAAAITLVRRLPEQRFVLDHLAKPDLRSGELGGWEAHLRELAALPNVACKLSGLVTEADWHNWTATEVHRACDVALDAFGSERLLYGSDWPVCLLASAYPRWWQTAEAFLEPLSAAEKAAVLGGNAVRWYGLA